MKWSERSPANGRNSPIADALGEAALRLVPVEQRRDPSGQLKPLPAIDQATLEREFSVAFTSIGRPVARTACTMSSAEKVGPCSSPRMRPNSGTQWTSRPSSERPSLARIRLTRTWSGGSLSQTGSSRPVARWSCSCLRLDAASSTSACRRRRNSSSSTGSSWSRPTDRR